MLEVRKSVEAAPGGAAGMLMLQDSSRQVDQVVLAGNIAKLSLALRQTGDGRALQGCGAKEMILSVICDRRNRWKFSAVPKNRK
ncbi:hypothetical protein JQ604_01620 [Bradyrhizobium jicamae]|uniref:hypothetical protein n=1 Tax=Bradyrhizobium jicamae TaxID=280332 RepID=UPI001BA5C6EA|nr:hypothetical protein [Bradyrhizobium jicamae]MBR0750863.1 hypothetical protein [Bradyrhizobium jicamae]